MQFSFVPLTEEFATAIVKGWKYPPPYDVFNYDKEEQVIYNRPRWGIFQFAVLNETGELVGELNTEFYDSNGEYLEAPHDGAELWFGFGMRPDLTGQGLGPSFVGACLEFSVRHHNYKGQYVCLATGAFNQRGIKAYRKIGFVEVHSPNEAVVWMRIQVKELETA